MDIQIQKIGDDWLCWGLISTMGKSFYGNERKKMKDAYKLERDKRQKRQIEEPKPERKENKDGDRRKY